MNIPSAAAESAKGHEMKHDDCPKDGFLITKNDKNGRKFEIRAYCLGHEPQNTNEENLSYIESSPLCKGIPPGSSCDGTQGSKCILAQKYEVMGKSVDLNWIFQRPTLFKYCAAPKYFNNFGEVENEDFHIVKYYYRAKKAGGEVTDNYCNWKTGKKMKWDAGRANLLESEDDCPTKNVTYKERFYKQKQDEDNILKQLESYKENYLLKKVHSE